MARFLSAFRAFWPALRQHLLRRRLLGLLLLSFAFGIALPYGLRLVLPAGPAAPYTAIAASFIIDLAGLAVLLCWLPLAAASRQPWAGAAAWLGGVLVCGAAWLGLASAGTHQESARTFFVLWGLFAGQGALVAAAYGVLALLCGRARPLAAQLTLVGLSLAATALFWSREPIQLLSRGAADQEASAAALLTGAVMKLNPPMAVASVWHQQSDAARMPGPASGSRFDLIRAPMTYEVWIGSYQAVPYPHVLPAAQEDGFRFGLIATMLLWGLPLLCLTEVLAALRDSGGGSCAGGQTPETL